MTGALIRGRLTAAQIGALRLAVDVMQGEAISAVIDAKKGDEFADGVTWTILRMLALATQGERLARMTP